MHKKILSVVLSVCVAVTFIPCAAFGAKADQLDVKDLQEVLSYDTTNAEMEATGSTDGLTIQSADSLPSKVDLRDRGVVTPVKFQNPFGDCWAFAACAAAETSLLSKMGKTYDQTKLDLSEHHLAYFAMNAINDSKNSQNGEGAHWLEGATSGDSLSTGGKLFTATSLFSSKVGPATESQFPYKGKKGTIETRLTEDDDLENYCYSADDDWSISEQKRFTSNYEIARSFSFPPPYDVFDEAFDKAYEEGKSEEEAAVIADQAREDELNLIKAVTNAGAGQIVTYHADTAKPGEGPDFTYLNPDNWCQFNPHTYKTSSEAEKKYGPNHAVCIVGYDDNYPKENFNVNPDVDLRQPAKDGAFLIKNSWGSQKNNFPNKGKGWGIVEDDVHTGYFWLSYYDATIGGVEAIDFDATASAYSICDQNTFMPSLKTVTYNSQSGKELKVANVFTAKTNQFLYAISFETSTYGDDVDFQVYRLNNNYKDPTDGQAITGGTVTCSYGGYHRESLGASVFLKAGQKYSIVVKSTTPENKTEIMMPINSSKEIYAAAKLKYYIESVINPGESYLYHGNNGWFDWKDAAPTILDSNPKTAEYLTDNFPIRGYSNPVPSPGKIASLKLKSKKKKMTITYSAASNCDAYQITYKYKGKKYKKWTTVTSSTTKYVTKKLKKGKKLQVKVRAYTKIGDTVLYGPWTAVKTKKVKR